MAMMRSVLGSPLKTSRLPAGTGQSPGFSREDWKVNSWSDPKWAPLRDVTVWLYQQLLGPIAERIEEADQLVIAPTGLMYYLPFHALGPFDPKTGEIGFLALRKKVSYVAPGSLLKTVDADAGATRRSQQQPRILALGDVKFEVLKPLAYAKDELTAIKTLFAGAAVLLDGPRATKNELLKALSDGSARDRKSQTETAGKGPLSPAGFTFVHLVTHGILDAKNPQESRLALEGSNSLKTYEIARLDLRGVSLVTLSACDTALARDNPGADLMSLGEYVSLAGAASVVVSLWSVDDLETKNLMKAFYTRLKQDGSDKVAALQRAQVELLKRPESRHPFYWAAFVLYGKGW